MALLSVSVPASARDAKEDQAALQGEWVGVSNSRNAKESPPDEARKHTLNI